MRPSRRGGANTPRFERHYLVRIHNEAVQRKWTVENRVNPEGADWSEAAIPLLKIQEFPPPDRKLIRRSA